MHDENTINHFWRSKKYKQKILSKAYLKKVYQVVKASLERNAVLTMIERCSIFSYLTSLMKLVTIIKKHLQCIGTMD